MDCIRCLFDGVGRCVSEAIGVGVVILLISTVAVTVFSGAWSSDNKVSFSESFMGKHYKKFIAALILLALAKACTPSSESVEKMAIAFGAAEVLQSDTAKNIGSEITKIAGKTADVVNKRLDKVLEESE